MKRLRKAVFPVAGLGTRFLPATKAMPKEMLTVVDRPLIQYAVEEALEAGIEQMIFVTGRGKTALEDHFDVAFELEAVMRSRGKPLDILDSTRLPAGARSLPSASRSRSASATPSGARASWSATSRSPCCSPTT
jgi:UTP--glucose-1-phosphate uridylyltransferase